MTATVLQRKASTQLEGLLLVPAVKELSTLICITSSQPEPTKLYNENIGGHRYILTSTKEKS